MNHHGIQGRSTLNCFLSMPASVKCAKNTASLPAAGLINTQQAKIMMECVLQLRALHTAENECPAICHNRYYNVAFPDTINCYINRSLKSSSNSSLKLHFQAFAENSSDCYSLYLVLRRPYSLGYSGSAVIK